jgi:RND superfamily putative drug exporter
VRFLVLLDDDPESAAAVSTLSKLQDDMPDLLARAGLSRAQVGFAGDTAITQELTDDTSAALLRVLPAALVILMALVWLLLRTWAAPVYLVASSMLVVAAALGLTVYVFQVWLGYGEISFFVPVTTAILLVALGSDYNVFLIGRIWLEAERRELRAAVRTAGSRAARAIAVAGVILAFSFAAIALIPILAFREIAFAMAVGLLLDAFVARPLLIPAMVTIFERGNDAFGERREEARPPESMTTPLRTDS